MRMSRFVLSNVKMPSAACVTMAGLEVSVFMEVIVSGTGGREEALFSGRCRRLCSHQDVMMLLVKAETTIANTYAKVIFSIDFAGTVLPVPQDTSTYLDYFYINNQICFPARFKNDLFVFTHSMSNCHSSEDLGIPIMVRIELESSLRRLRSE